jgi:hypothetical protein
MLIADRRPIALRLLLCHREGPFAPRRPAWGGLPPSPAALVLALGGGGTTHIRSESS